jgi:hypothetical protein
MKNEIGKFTFKVPEGHEDAGKKIEKAFEFKVCDTLSEATEVMTDKKWSLLDMVNETLKANARSNAYQSALLPYRPSEVSQDDIVERMVRDYIRIGVSEETARKQVAALLQASKSE